MQVSSEKCEYLFLSTQNFREKFYNHSIVMKTFLNNRVDERKKFHGELETKKTDFTQQNRPVYEGRLDK